MSASHPQAHDAPRGDSILSTRTKQAGRALLAPIVRLAPSSGSVAARRTDGSRAVNSCSHAMSSIRSAAGSPARWRTAGGSTDR